MRCPRLGRNQRRAKRAPGRCLRQGLFIQQCRVMHYSQIEGSSILSNGFGSLRSHKAVATDSGKVYALSTGTLHVSACANGMGKSITHAACMRALSLRKLGRRGWDIRLCESGMETRNQDGDLFSNIGRMLVGADSTHRELEKRPEQVALPATAKRAAEWRRL